MSQWQIALVREQGVNFAVAAVRDHVIHNQQEAEGLITALSVRLSQPVVLLGAQRHETYGRPDIVRFMRNVHPSQLPWRRMKLAG